MSLYRFAKIKIIFLVFNIISFSSFAGSLVDAIPECQKWVSQTDSLYESCMQNRRHFDRVFKPSGWGEAVPDDNSVWFFPSLSHGHFFVGCSFRDNERLSYLGLYYTLDPYAIQFSNSATIVSVTPDGDVSILLNGNVVTFITVRPFLSSKINFGWRSSSTNCNDPTDPRGYVHPLAQGPLKVDFSHFTKDNNLTVYLSENFKRKNRYIELFPDKNDDRILWHEIDESIIITEGGSLYADTERFKFFCSLSTPDIKKKSISLINQICTILANK